MKKSGLMFLTLVLMYSTSSLASEVKHFQGKESTTLQEALQNIETYNQELQQIIASDVDAVAMAKVHELTYTLEKALAKIQESVGQMAQDLEEVHLSSESLDADIVKNKGADYLQYSNQLVNH